MAKKSEPRGRFTRLVQVWVTEEIDDGIDRLVNASSGGLENRSNFLRKVLYDLIKTKTAKTKGATR